MSKIELRFSQRKVGIFQIVLSGIFFGLLGTIGKQLIDGGFSPGELLCVRYFFSALLLWPVIILTSPRWKLPFKKIVVCALLGACGYAVFSSWYFIALQGLSASLAVLLLYTYPIIVAGFGWFFWNEKIPKDKWPSLPLAIVGLVLLIWGDISVGKVSALFYGIGAAVIYAIYILISSRALRDIPPFVSLTYILTFAGLSLSIVNLKHSSEHLVPLVIRFWPSLLALVFLCGISAMGLFMAGLQKLKTWEVSLLSLLEPVVGVAMATIFLGERLSVIQMIGGTLVLVALVIVSLPSRKSRSAIL